jgi:Uncharacterized protein conserved in bacteria
MIQALDHLSHIMFLIGTLIGEKKGGSSRMLELSKKENFYQQEYCGCVYSLRDTNNWRASKGREKVERGVKFYQEAKLKLSQSD